ncbi:MAG: ComF family protein [Gemmatimonadaceae bacterium]|nr:ComF family protein [Gemmatimonadaceae bacterium]
MHALKYDGWTATADAMASRMERLSWPRDVTEGRTAVVAVPLSAARLRERGFNQSQHLADRLARVWRIPLWTDVLLRVRATRSQTELTPAERLGNVAGAFSVPHSAAPVVRGAHVILVDDVITTGATLGACAKALFASGALTISYMTFGRAPDSGDRIFTGERDYNGNQGWHQRIWPDRTTGPSRREGGPG